jgi:hypothetical protein
VTYSTDEQRREAIKNSRKRYYLKTRKLKGYCKERPWQRRNHSKEYKLWHQARQRAKQANIPFEIEIEDIVIPDICPAIGIPIVLTNDKQCSDSPSIDRIDNEKGYTKDNIQVISWRANRLKWNGTLDEIKGILEYMLKKA